ncbi:phosphotransferase [Bosea sp. (in: a-proteobacteria)]|uniref:phosphotransferase n=1 Tax=Bosea sp. (in: a-proteobacteria) TaxID=1871050 RepID=UPI003B3AB521
MSRMTTARAAGRPAIGAGLSVVAPQLDEAAAERIAAEHYGLVGRASSLVGEKDSNFRLALGDGRLFFLKVLSPGEDPAVSNMHSRALMHVERTAPELPLPRIVPALSGCEDFRLTVAPGDVRTVRMTTFSAGRAQSAGARTPAQSRALGALLGRLQAALSGFSHPAAEHETSWDMAHAGLLRPILETWPDPAERTRLAAVLGAFAREVEPRLSELPRQVVHNDLNGDNILVDPDRPDRISGIIDFGDMVRTALLFDVAIGAAYQLGTEGDILAPAAAFLEGYASVSSLSEIEIALLPLAIQTRMAMRILIPAWRAERFPERCAYIMRNSRSVWSQFAQLDAVGPTAVAARLAAACAVPEETR